MKHIPTSELGAFIKKYTIVTECMGSTNVVANKEVSNFLKNKVNPLCDSADFLRLQESLNRASRKLYISYYKIIAIEKRGKKLLEHDKVDIVRNSIIRPYQQSMNNRKNSPL